MRARRGVSGFRVPVAVYAGEDTKQFRVALLTDDGGDGAGTFETHVHRPRALGQRGWKVLRITSPEWNRARSEVLGRVEAMLRG